MTHPEIVIPDLPAPIVETEHAHTCDGWIEHPKGQRPRCERCDKRRERYEQHAAGNGTVAEIREAVDALEHVQGKTPLGECIRTELRGVKVWACPRSINLGHADDPIPLVDVAGNRSERRLLDRNAKVGKRSAATRRKRKKKR